MFIVIPIPFFVCHIDDIDWGPIVSQAQFITNKTTYNKIADVSYVPGNVLATEKDEVNVSIFMLISESCNSLFSSLLTISILTTSAHSHSHFCYWYSKLTRIHASMLHLS